MVFVTRSCTEDSRRCTEIFLCGSLWLLLCVMFFCYTECYGGGTEEARRGTEDFLCGSPWLLCLPLCEMDFCYTEYHGGGTELHGGFFLCGSPWLLCLFLCVMFSYYTECHGGGTEGHGGFFSLWFSVASLSFSLCNGFLLHGLPRRRHGGARRAFFSVVLCVFFVFLSV